MIWKLLFEPFVFITKEIVNIISQLGEGIPTVGNFLYMLSKGLTFFPIGAFGIAISNITYWSVLHLAHAIILYVIKKIPFISIN